MSCIAGVLALDGGAADSTIQTVVLHLPRLPGWSIRVERASGGAVAWSGASAASIARRGDRLVVVAGHVYNAPELGADANGTLADLILDLAERQGFTDSLGRLNGDFAVALLDLGAGRVLLGRDRFGVQPLYWTQGRDLAIFGSRPRSLAMAVERPLEPDRRFVALFAGSHYRAFDDDPEASPYAGVHQVAPGHVVAIGPTGHWAQRYWALRELPEFEAPEPELARRYRDLLADAVAIRLRHATERPAFTLSGGMDSSSVLALAVHAVGHPLPAVSAVYTDSTYDESAEIRPLEGVLAQPWVPVAVDEPDVLATVQRLIAVHEEPVATATWLSHFLLCEEVSRRGYGALFGGLGGDELNAGEYEYFVFHFADLRRAGLEDRLAQEVDAWIRHHDHPIFRKSVAVAESAMTRLVDSGHPGRVLPDRARLTRYQAALAPGVFDLVGFVPAMEHLFRSYLKTRTYQDLTRETLPPCLRAEDRNTAAFGLDHFLPFLDHRVVEFMFRSPGTMKIRDGVTKILLRRAMCGVLPEGTRTRVKKTGWNAPAHLWFAGKNRDSLLDLLHSRAFRERGIYDVTEVWRLADEHDRIVTSGTACENHMMFFWQLVNLELWLQTL